MATNDRELYNIELFINNTQYTVEPTMFSFSMKDSIHNLFPRFTLTILDKFGLFLEYLAFVEGNEVKVQYGFDGNVVENKYVFIDNNLDKIIHPSYINGEVTCQAVHDYFKNQNVISKGYMNRISLIVRELIANYTFQSVNINDTGNNDYWYQPLMTDAKFMTQLLLPNAYSTDSGDTPYFMFIGNDNSFNLRHYRSMIEQGVKKTFYYVKQQIREYSRNDIIAFQKGNAGSFVTEKTKKRLLFSYSRDNGDLIEDEDGILTYPKTLQGSSASVPIIANDNYKSFDFLGYEETDIGQKENVLGRKINSMKDSFFIEKLIITVPLDTTINAGSTIEIKVPTPSSTNEEDSVFYSGKYLVEEAEHVWNGKNKDGFSVLNISRKSVRLNNQYVLNEKLFKG